MIQNQEAPPPAGVDTAKPSAARLYNWHLGDASNTSNPLRPWDSGEMSAWFGDWRLLEPSGAHAASRRPDDVGVDKAARQPRWVGFVEKA